MRYWHYYESGEKAGPVAEPELISLFRSGSLPGNTLVWTEGLKDWREARSIKNLVLTAGAAPD